MGAMSMGRPISKATVEQIRKLLRQRMETGQPTPAAIAARCGVSEQTVYNVAKGRSIGERVHRQPK